MQSQKRTLFLRNAFRPNLSKRTRNNHKQGLILKGTLLCGLFLLSALLFSTTYSVLAGTDVYIDTLAANWTADGQGTTNTNATDPISGGADQVIQSDIPNWGGGLNLGSDTSYADGAFETLSFDLYSSSSLASGQQFQLFICDSDCEWNAGAPTKYNLTLPTGGAWESYNLDIATDLGGGSFNRIWFAKTGWDGSVQTIYLDNVVLSTTPPAPACTDCVSGNVYRDFTSDGSRDTVAPGVAEIIVTAYKADGSVADQTTTDGLGDYSLSAITESVRIEFTGMPAYLHDGFAGSESGSTLRFAEPGDADVDLALSNPAQYSCGTDNAQVGTTCWARDGGDDVDLLISIPYESGTTSQTSNDGVDASADHIGLGTVSELGSVLDGAYARSSDSLYHGAFMKMGAAFPNRTTGSQDPGIIYRTSDAYYNPLSASAWITLSAGVDPHIYSPDIADTEYISTSISSKVGRIGLAGLDLSNDDSTLYAWNLFSRQIEVIAIDSTSGAGTIGTPISLPASLDTTYCPGSTARPGALHIHPDSDTPFVGLTCEDASNGYVFEINTVSGAFDLRATIPLSYDRHVSGYGAMCPASSSTPCAENNFQSWVDDLTVPGVMAHDASTNLWYRPQPWLIDLAFDEENYLIVGFNDRSGHMTGPGFATNSIVNNGTAILTDLQAAGDILLLAPPVSPAVVFTLENNGAVGDRTSTNPDNGKSLGAGGMEFYWHDTFDIGKYSTSEAWNRSHGEISHGGIETLYGTGEVIVSSYDPAPVDDFNNYSSGGLIYLNNVNGERARSARLYTQSTADVFGKQSGIGNVFLMCPTAPIEIGNRVWWDANLNGRQDPGSAEQPIAGLTLELYLIDASDTFTNGQELTTVGSTLVATTVTDAQGRYYFSSAADSADNKVPAGYQAQVWLSGTDVLTDRDYQVRIAGWSNASSTNGAILDALAGPGAQVFLAPGPNTGAGSSNIMPSSDSVAANSSHDSDAYDNPGSAAVYVNTGASGENNHSFDIAFGAPEVSVGSLGSIEVSKSIVDDDGSNAPTNWEFTLSTSTAGCTVAGLTNPITIAGDASNSPQVFANVPMTSTSGLCEYSVVETAAVNWISAETTTGPYTVSETVTTTVSFTNTYEDLSLKEVTIGNYVWLDSDEDGQQNEGGSTGIPGVVVGLYPPIGSTPVATTTTDATGYYTFTKSADGIFADQNYIIRVDGEQAALSDYNPTLTDAVSNSVDATDSDGTPVTSGTWDGYLVTSAATPSLGEADLTFDFGFTQETPKDWGDLPSTSAVLASEDGPHHLAPSGTTTATVWLGENMPDYEEDGVESLEADGDDNAGTPDDEDGFTIFNFPVPGESMPTYIEVNGSEATLDVGYWIDWDANGVFTDTVDFFEFYDNYSTDDGGQPSYIEQVVDVPLGITPSGKHRVRIRAYPADFATEADHSNVLSTGGVTDGEVEDHLISPDFTAVGFGRINTTLTQNPLLLTTTILALLGLSAGLWRRRSS